MLEPLKPYEVTHETNITHGKAKKLFGHVTQAHFSRLYENKPHQSLDATIKVYVSHRRTASKEVNTILEKVELGLTESVFKSLLNQKRVSHVMVEVERGGKTHSYSAECRDKTNNPRHMREIGKLLCDNIWSRFDFHWKAQYKGMSVPESVLKTEKSIFERLVSTTRKVISKSKRFKRI